MKKSFLLAVAASMPVWAVELPPVIPAGPITYDEVTYAPADSEFPAATTPTADAFPAADATFTEPITPAASSERRLRLGINAYSSDYQVRGMGVTDSMSRYGFSSINASYIPTNRNLFGMGIQQRIAADVGFIWGAGDVLGDTPMMSAHYGLGKEIFPNLVVEAGYTLRYGGMEGFAARYVHGAPRRVAQDLNLSVRFDDHQRGFFGGFEWGYGFQGLTGHYMDIEAGYRFTDVATLGNYGLDLELSAGVAPSFGYWGADVDGIDAYRLKVSLLPYNHSGTLGRDANWQVRPWVQASWSGNNAKKIDRAYGYGPVDHCQLTIGVEVTFQF